MAMRLRVTLRGAIDACSCCGCSGDRWVSVPSPRIVPAFVSGYQLISAVISVCLCECFCACRGLSLMPCFFVCLCGSQKVSVCLWCGWL